MTPRHQIYRIVPGHHRPPDSQVRWAQDVTVLDLRFRYNFIGNVQRHSSLDSTLNHTNMARVQSVSHHVWGPSSGLSLPSKSLAEFVNLSKSGYVKFQRLNDDLQRSSSPKKVLDHDHRVLLRRNFATPQRSLAPRPQLSIVLVAGGREGGLMQYVANALRCMSTTHGFISYDYSHHERFPFATRGRFYTTTGELPSTCFQISQTFHF